MLVENGGICAKRIVLGVIMGVILIQETVCLVSIFIYLFYSFIYFINISTTFVNKSLIEVSCIVHTSYERTGDMKQKVNCMLC